jgi:transposase
MPKRIKLRTLTKEDEKEIRRIANSRKTENRLVKRAQILVNMLDDPDLPAFKSGHLVGFSSPTIGPKWVQRYNERGLTGLLDKPRSGRKRTHAEKTRSALLDLVLQKPRTLGYPFELWTLERVQRAFKERVGIHLSDSTIWNWVEEEGFRWRKQESWFHEPEKHDPEFVEKRGSS